MYYFCTYFDKNFLYRGLALYESLRQHTENFELWVLCFDTETYDILNNLSLPGLSLISLKDFETVFPELPAVKKDRSYVEYYWTTTPYLPRYVLNMQSQADLITYLDADLFFYGSPRPIYDELGDGSIFICPHYYEAESVEKRGHKESVVGRYNVGLVIFRRDKTGLTCLERWAKQCLDWCYVRAEPGLLGDQKYLDDWPERFDGVVVSQNHGLGVGGWNIFRYKTTWRNRQIFINDLPLIMLHFNFVELLGNRFLTGCSRWYLRKVYHPYASALRKSMERVKSVAPMFRPKSDTIPLWRFFIRLIRGGIVHI